MSILLTGAAGFIGFHVAKALLERGDRVVGVDNVNDYYDVRLKEARLALLSAYPGFVFAKLDVADRDGVFTLVESPSRPAQHYPSRSAGRGSLLAREPVRLHRRQCDGDAGDAGGGPPHRQVDGDHLCLVLLGLRRQPEAAF